MKRQDYDMPFMLRYENVAWYEDGEVRILDRRVYPKEIRFEICRTHKEVARAIKDMVTQSAGPYTAAGMGMALAAYEARDLRGEDLLNFLEDAAETISTARPTTSTRLRKVTRGSIEAAKKAMESGDDVVEALFQESINSLNRRYSAMNEVAKYLCDLIPDGGKVLTQCFAETIIGTMTRTLKEQGKDVKFYCTETRPYYQGARLTATCISQMGFDTTVITDNMVAYTMENIGIDLFTSASDTITLDGHVANKVGTHQIALVARPFKVPFYVTGMPDGEKKAKDDIVIELRDPSLVLGDHTARGVKAIYPSFDITPPELITGFVTDKGLYKPSDLKKYLDTDHKSYY
ncbi:s-methyl-5-thioribose-1-phosphate isomerase [Peptoniphilus sp. HMSC062D09]|uniref:s-methyl-5-thioribose-1-phosphate isomerase n=1 Tax=Peptoniphilus sp. HMSC062D09 TaxID=1739305 RepID=UPI0008A18FCC|nr:s-methyl-5-thioribose-1-phosphate isomerase [Peptoniphilus sp. HMSC062D09]OFK84914.1 S-methyl-5-thioribose-1-phosphate isomerase [Peptoniphilus sp. HMSC062D09]